MSHARRRRTLRCTVLAASLAVLASFVVAPAAQAETPPADPTTSAGPTGSEPVPTDAGPTEPSATPVTPDPGAEPAGTTDEPSDPAGVTSGDTVVGQLVQAWPDPTAEEHAHEDAEGHHDEAPLSWIEPADGDAVRVPTDSLPDVAVGSTLAVTVGDEVVDEASAEQGFAPAVEVQAATVVDAATPDPTTASAGSAPTNTVTAVLVLPAGATSDGMTIGNVVNTLNGAVSSFWDEQSNGSIRITAVQGASTWVRTSKDCSNPYAMWDDVAAQVGWTGGAGKHLMLYVPSNASGCAYGLGTVGSSIGTGGRSYVEASALSVMAHELGHNFGLGHSSELQCNSSLESGTCQTRSYYDFYDVMGISWGQVGSLNTAQAARLGLLPTSEQVALTPSSTATAVTLAPVSASSGVRAIKLTASNGSVYYVEYRQASGQDAWLSDARNSYRLDRGVVIRRAASGSDTSLLLDGTPSPTSAWASDTQQAISVGQQTSVAAGEFTVLVAAADQSSADVQVVTPAGAGPRLLAGSQLASGQSLGSADGSVKVVMQADGNLVSYGTSGRVLWATYTYSPGARLVMQPDGNAVIYALDGRPVWNSGTWSNPGASLVIKADGSSVVVTPAGRELWGTVADTPGQLAGGQRLTSYQYLVSPRGTVKLVMQPDGNLVSYGTSGRVVWAAGTYSPGAALVMQADGNAVVYSVDGQPVWNSGTWGHPGGSLSVTADGASVISSPQDGPMWGTAGDTPSQLSAGQVLYPGQFVTSPDGSVQTIMQADGNLVSYGPGRRVLWATSTYSPGARLVMQSDGNAVIYAPDGRVVWHSGTWGHPNNRLVIKSDGSTVVRTPGGTELWGTNGL